ncbi:PD-(D/E)XK nuclease-like domain-containing protein [Rhizobium sp. BK251]|uniref:PD-(D/E)XK nuclease-like domain-containing protein n=1 Tax=Rhizobium sp. BK251 TaxID=2512125 RepID=UPI0010450783|nr:PD-(D/E)XK nuclease-like domain-containing protein [Rhizobium sp. BK251]TCL70608.1 PDDEXK-like uncharacterized protein DUF3799 [Rhizobium sp. BK251]
MDKIIDKDSFQSVGSTIGGMIAGLKGERKWSGSTIKLSGVYSGISLDDYHGKRDLLDGPSVSKSALKWLLPAHGGSPKAFWGRWKWNPDHIEQETTAALDFGKAAHCLLLGDEVFEERFCIRPEKYPDYRTKEARDWRDALVAEGKTIITAEQFDRIKRIHADAKTYPLIKLGLLNGRIERSMFWKDPETGIWLRARPDALPNVDGVYSDLKTASKFDEDFLERQIFDAGYYLQAAITRMVCRGLGMPFDTFTLLYVLNDDVPDTAHVEIDEFDIDRGERAVRWCLRTIRNCLDAGEWPGARPFNDGERRIQMKVWAKERLDNFLDIAERQEAA